MSSGQTQLTAMTDLVWRHTFKEAQAFLALCPHFHITPLFSLLLASSSLIFDRKGYYSSHMADTPNSDNRSLSRGRDVFQSSGRGGAGNIRRTSLSREPRPFDGPDDISQTRGREPAVHPDRVYSVGRGGAGNMRSPSRDPARFPHDPSVPSVHEDLVAESPYEQRILREHAAAEEVHHTGRGGVGNITRSRSRSRGPVVTLHSTGRGGAGNMLSGETRPSTEVVLDQEERKRHCHGHAEGIHSTGRGGVANLTDAHGPDVEHVHHHTGEYESSGRGGSGNIRSPSQPRAPGSRDPSKEKPHGVAALWNKMAHPGSHPPHGQAGVGQ